MRCVCSNKKYGFLLFLFVLFLFLPGFAFAASYAIGVPEDSPEADGIIDWAPLAQYLTLAIPDAEFTILPLKRNVMGKAIAQGEVDFIAADPITYVGISLEAEVDRLASRKKRAGDFISAECGSTVFSLNSKITLDKKGISSRKIAAVSPDSFMGWLAAKREFVKLGYDPGGKLGNVKFAGSADKVIELVLSGASDIGVIPGGVLENLYAQGQFKPETFHIYQMTEIEQARCPFRISTRTYPGWTFAARSGMSLDLVGKITLALIDMPFESKAATSAGSAGWTIPLNYLPVLECLKDLKYGPYSGGSKSDFQLFFVEHRYWLIAITILTIILVVLFLSLMRTMRRMRIASRQLHLELLEKHEAEKALKISEENYRGIFEHVNDAIFIHNAHSGEILDFNHRAQELFGFTDAQAPGLSLNDLSTDESFFRVEDAVQWIRKSATSEYKNIEGKAKDLHGRKFWIEIDLKPIVLQGVNRVISVVRDITERKRAEAALRQSEERYRNIVENLAEGVCIVDLDEKFTFCNPAAERIFGVGEGELTGKKLTEFLDEENNQTVRQQTQNRLKGQIDNYNIRITRGDGEIRGMMVTAGPRYDESGEVIGAYGIFHDNTEQRKLEQALASSEEQLRDFLDNAHDLIQSSNTEQKFVFVNKKWKQVMGYNDEEIKNLHVFDIIYPDSRKEMEENYKQLMQGKSLEGFEAALLTKNGRKIFVRGSANCRMENGKPVLTRCILHDVTQLKETEDILREQAIRDPLTNLYNRRYMLERIQLQFETTKRYGHNYCICICDLDNFKRINDTFGHHSGDEALLFFGKLLGKMLRRIDLVGRYGGDEFLVLFPHVNAQEAKVALERVRVAMSETAFHSLDGDEFHVTTTYGVVEANKEYESVKALLIAADNALYEGKAKGRDRIEILGEPD